MHTYTLHAYIHIYVITYVHTCVSPCLHTCMRTHMHTVTYLFSYIHTCVHTYLHSCMHACIHTHIQIPYKYHTHTIQIPYQYHTIPYHTIQADVEDGTGGIKYSCSLVKNIQVQAVLLAFSMRFTDIGLYMPARPWIRTLDHQNGKTCN